MVLAGDQAPGRNAAERLLNAGLGDRPGVGGSLDRCQIGGRGPVEVAGEDLPEVVRIDGHLRTVRDGGRDRLVRPWGLGGQFTHRLTLRGDEAGDVDQGPDVGVRGGGVGDHRAAVGVADQHQGAVDRGQVAGDVGRVAGEAPQGVGDGAYRIAVLAQPLYHRGPAGGIRPRSMDEDDGRLRGGSCVGRHRRTRRDGGPEQSESAGGERDATRDTHWCHLASTCQNRTFYVFGCPSDFYSGRNRSRRVEVPPL